MNVPSGYTALDLIGFTDRGDYSSSANYVKNDLVHSGGRVWLCLVDDTTNITPAVGANWKIWIDEAAYLSGLADTTITSPIDGQVLRYDIATNKWVNASVDSSPTQSSTNLVQSGGVYTQLANKANTSDLATVATTGAYSDLSGKPNLAAVATSGSYNDLLNKPMLGTAAAKDSTNAVTQNSTDLVESGAVYSEVNTVKQALSTQVNELGAKNLLPNNAASGVSNGITYTVNNDGSVTASGTANSGGSRLILYDSYVSTLSKGNFKPKNNVSYKISGCPSGGSSTTFAFYFAYRVGDTWKTSRDSGSGNTFTFSDVESSERIQVYIEVADGKSVNGTFYPMIRPATITDNTYVPYAMSNRNLTTALTTKVNTSDIANNLTTTAEGKVLDARQGKALNDALTALSNPSSLFVVEKHLWTAGSVPANGSVGDFITTPYKSGYKCISANVFSWSNCFTYTQNVDVTDGYITGVRYGLRNPSSFDVTNQSYGVVFTYIKDSV